MTAAFPPTRKSWMATLAKTPPARLAALMPDLPPLILLDPLVVQGRDLL